MNQKIYVTEKTLASLLSGEAPKNLSVTTEPDEENNVPMVPESLLIAALEQIGILEKRPTVHQMNVTGGVGIILK